ncbi:hypothetical protein LWI29_036860 [Acer saccharum]|uniref:Retrotransposon gag domain-containing protein n=1 Tax=Acer saccharum TaxID=4024 RepID=A0AA39SSV2_ACESA|nr:hypothetical protein LWI29_036860 [Acer saccharum]
MAGQDGCVTRSSSGGHGVPHNAEPQERERDHRDIEMDDWRRQVQQLAEHLTHNKTQEHDEFDHGSKNEASTEEDDINPFHHMRRRESSGEDRSRRHGRNYVFPQRGLDVKVDIPEFARKMHTEEFIDWLNTVERVFDYKDVEDEKKVKLMAIKLKKHASNWWEHLKKQRAREGKKRIVTWTKLKKELKKKFVPQHYLQDSFLKFHNFKQRDLSVEEFTTEFDNLKMLCDLDEPEEQTITR